MTSRKVLVDLLIAAKVAPEDAEALAAIEPKSGGSWTAEGLDSGKVDETLFTAELARVCRSPIASVEGVNCERPRVQLLPSRFVFKHHILPLASTPQSAKLASWDVFNLV